MHTALSRISLALVGDDLGRNTKADATTHFQKRKKKREKIIIKTLIVGAYIAEKLLTLGLVSTNKI